MDTLRFPCHYTVNNNNEMRALRLQLVGSMKSDLSTSKNVQLSYFIVLSDWGNETDHNLTLLSSDPTS